MLLAWLFCAKGSEEMGTWNIGLFSNDSMSDVRDTYIELLKQQVSNETAFERTYEEYQELIGTENESLFWYALADTQWHVGRLMPVVKEKALYYIENEDGGKWKNKLEKL